MTVRTISSQHYLNDEIVAAKVAAGDFGVSVSPEFTYEGETFRVVLDGHHSLAAANEVGAEVECTELTATQHDAIGLLASGAVLDFLEVTSIDGDYYDIATGKSVW
jgi:hypothetical protein